MNFYAKKLGMSNTNYTNSTGLHDSNHFSTPYDMTLLAKSLIRIFQISIIIFQRKNLPGMVFFSLIEIIY